MISSSVCCSIYIVHDEVKDKAFELELSWVGEGTTLTNHSLASLLHLPSCCYGNNTETLLSASFQLQTDDTHSFPKMSKRKRRNMPR